MGRTMIKLSEETPRWFNAKENMPKERLKAPHSHTALHKECIGEKKKKRSSKDHRNTIKRHLRQSERDSKEVFCNVSKWRENSESSHYTVLLIAEQVLHSQPSIEALATYITSTT